MKRFYHRTFLFMEGFHKPDHKDRLPPVKKGIKNHSFIEGGEFEWGESCIFAIEQIVFFQTWHNFRGATVRPESFSFWSPPFSMARIHSDPTRVLKYFNPILFFPYRILGMHPYIFRPRLIYWQESVYGPPLIDPFFSTYAKDHTCVP